MAKNFVKEGLRHQFAVTAGLKSGDPVVIGQIPGVLETDADAANKAVVNLTGVFNLSVKGVDASANAAVAVGDAIYYVQADTPKLSKKNTGVLFGYALGAVVSGATTTIEVRLKG